MSIPCQKSTTIFEGSIERILYTWKFIFLFAIVAIYDGIRNDIAVVTHAWIDGLYLYNGVVFVEVSIVDHHVEMDTSEKNYHIVHVIGNCQIICCLTCRFFELEIYLQILKLRARFFVYLFYVSIIESC
jgi:hypothetical protein